MKKLNQSEMNVINGGSLWGDVTKAAKIVTNPGEGVYEAVTGHDAPDAVKQADVIAKAVTGTASAIVGRLTSFVNS